MKSRLPHCSSCHDSRSRLREDVLLARRGPALPADRMSFVIPGFKSAPDINRDARGRWFWKNRTRGSSFYVFGLSRRRLVDRIGITLMLAVLAAIAFHAARRRWKMPPPTEKTAPLYIYPLYERLWHWTMSLSVIMLTLTGMAIHWAGASQIGSLALTVSIHNILAAVLVANAGLSLFFHVATGQIRQFFIFNRRFLNEIVLQIHYYLKGIYRHTPHPFGKTAERKFNPLQQVTYAVLLNILLPFQIISGLFMWAVDRWPAIPSGFGGLAAIAPWHNLGSWLLLTFLIMHMYLVTTGYTPLSALTAMITGYEKTPPSLSESERQELTRLPLLDLVMALARRSRRPTSRSGESR